jgi:hypothetical protein
MDAIDSHSSTNARVRPDQVVHDVEHHRDAGRVKMGPPKLSWGRNASNVES